MIPSKSQKAFISERNSNHDKNGGHYDTCDDFRPLLGIIQGGAPISLFVPVWADIFGDYNCHCLCADGRGDKFQI